MRKLIMLGAALLIGQAWAQPVTVIPATPEACNGRGTIDAHSTTGEPTFSWYIPAKFPQPAQSKEVVGAWTLDCPRYSITSDNKTVVMKSKTGKDADIFENMSRIYFYFGGYYRYPELKLEWLDYNFSLRADKDGLLNFDSDGEATRYRYAFTAGYRTDGGELKPLLFQGKLYESKIKPGKLTEIYFRSDMRDRINWAYVSYDAKAKVLTLRREYPFPDK